MKWNHSIPSADRVMPMCPTTLRATRKVPIPNFTSFENYNWISHWVTINFSAFNRKYPITCKTQMTCSRGFVDITRTKFPNVVVLANAISPVSRTSKTPLNANVFWFYIFWVCSSKFSVFQVYFTIRLALPLLSLGKTLTLFRIS
jgi:hypothetical protein